MHTRGGDDEHRAALRKIEELEAANLELALNVADLERRRKTLASSNIKLALTNSKLKAAQEQRRGVIKFMGPGSGMWSKEVDVLVLMLARWDLNNVVDLTLRALYRLRGEDGLRLGLQLHSTTGGLFDKMQRDVIERTLQQSRQHLEQHVFSPIKGEISPQIAVTKPGVFRKTMSSEVEG